MEGEEVVLYWEIEGPVDEFHIDGIPDDELKWDSCRYDGPKVKNLQANTTFWMEAINPSGTSKAVVWVVTHKPGEVWSDQASWPPRAKTRSGRSRASRRRSRPRRGPSM